MMAAAIALLQVQPRFERIGPLPTLPPVWIDAQQYGIGVAQTTARSKNLQARILWIDGTANLDKLSNDADIAWLQHGYHGRQADRRTHVVPERNRTETDRLARPNDPCGLRPFGRHGPRNQVSWTATICLP